MITVKETGNPFARAKVIGRGIDPAVYHRTSGKRGDKDFVMSRSELMEFHHCPSRWLKGFVGKDSSATEWGTLLDCLLLDSTNFANRFAVAPASYPAEGKRKGDPPVIKPWNWNATYCQEWRETLTEGMTVVKSADYEEANAALRVLLDDPTVKELVQTSDAQVSVLAEYEDDDTGLVIPVKALIDLVPDVNCERFGKTLMDFKTANSAAPGPWQNAVHEYGYHVQAALYLDAYTAATGEDRTDWFFIIQENYVPWELGKRFLSSEFVTLGRMRYMDALARYAKCLATNQWPSYDTDPMGLSFHGFNICEPPAWAINRL